MELNPKKIREDDILKYDSFVKLVDLLEREINHATELLFRRIKNIYTPSIDEAIGSLRKEIHSLKETIDQHSDIIVKNISNKIIQSKTQGKLF